MGWYWRYWGVLGTGNGLQPQTHCPETSRGTGSVPEEQCENVHQTGPPGEVKYSSEGDRARDPWMLCLPLGQSAGADQEMFAQIRKSCSNLSPEWGRGKGWISILQL